MSLLSRLDAPACVSIDLGPARFPRAVDPPPPTGGKGGVVPAFLKCPALVAVEFLTPLELPPAVAERRRALCRPVVELGLRPRGRDHAYWHSPGPRY